MSDQPLPPVPPIADRRLLLALAEASEAVASLSLGMLSANQSLRIERMGRARIGFDLAVHRLNELLGNILPPRDGPQIVRPFEPPPAPEGSSS